MPSVQEVVGRWIELVYSEEAVANPNLSCRGNNAGGVGALGVKSGEVGSKGSLGWAGLRQVAAAVTAL